MSLSVLLISVALTSIFSILLFLPTPMKKDIVRNVSTIILSKHVMVFHQSRGYLNMKQRKALSPVIWQDSFFMVSIALPLPSCMAINQASSRQAFAAEPCALITMSWISLAWWRENQIQLAWPAKWEIWKQIYCKPIKEPVCRMNWK